MEKLKGFVFEQGRTHIKNKGFVFTLDAMYAVLLLSVFLLSFSMSVPKSEDVSLLSKTGNDLLSAIDNYNGFSFVTQSDAVINSNMDLILAKLPTNINGKITLQRYVPQSGAIVLSQTYTRQDSAPLTEKINAIRAYPDISNDKYYLIKLELWYE